MKEYVVRLIRNYITNDTLLNKNLISIYSMGSFAKMDVFSDIDLNFFVKENNSKLMNNVRAMIDFFLKNYELYLDINIIDKDMIDNDFLKSKLFIHRNRHSMILYELKCINNNLIYGEDILETLNYNIEDIMIECVKLSLTIRHTICKLYLQKNIPDNMLKTIKKNARYCIEFYLLFNGIKDPYSIEIDNYINEYDFFKSNANVIKNIYNKLDSNLVIENYYDFIISLSKEIKNNIIYIIENKVSSDYYDIDRLVKKYEEQF